MPEVLSAAQKKQTKILQVASEMFLERGYDAVSLDDIVEKVGGSKSTLYSYYGGKEGLFAAIVHQGCRTVLGRLLELDVSDLDVKSGLIAIGRIFLSRVSSHEGQAFYRMMIAESARFPKLVSEFYVAGPEATTKLIRKNLEHWQKKGILRLGNSETLAVQFVGLLLGHFTAKSMLGLAQDLSEEKIEDWVSSSVTLFLEGALLKP
jgi:AcrR family transcriptional regulator